MPQRWNAAAPWQLAHMRLLVLHNVSAGECNVTRDVLCAPFVAAGFDILYRQRERDTISDEDLARTNVMVIAGGDGTVARAVLAYRDRVACFAIVPLGTANNIAQGIGGDSFSCDAAGRLDAAQERLHDIGQLEIRGQDRQPEEHGFLEGIGIGAITAAMAAAAAKDMTGADKQRFSRAALPGFISDAVACDWQITVDGQPLPDDLILAEVLNGPRIGPALRLAPQADPGDGMFDIAFLRHADKARALHALGRGGADDLPLDVIRGRAVSMQWHTSPLCVDDRFLDPPRTPMHLRIGFARDPVTFLVPPR